MRIEIRRLSAWLCIFLVGCGGTTAAKPDGAGGGGSETASECPSPSQVLLPAACEDVPELQGLTPEYAIELGTAGLNPLWFGRLICPNGELAVATRMPELAMPWSGSTSPVSDVMQRVMGRQMDVEDVLDVWRIECPGEPPVDWYTNMYRCGNSCPPRGYGVVHPTVMDWTEYVLGAAEAVQGGADPAEVRNEMFRLGAIAATYDNRSNLVMALMTVMALQGGNIALASQTIEMVTARAPSDRPDYWDLRAQVHLADENYSAAEEDLLWLMENFEGHATWPTWACTLSSVYATLGRAQDAIQYARRGCEAGGQCCDVAQAPASDPAYPECSGGPGPTPT